MRHGDVYILASKYRGTLYIGVTNDLVRRIEEHRSVKSPGSFTERYRVLRLVYWEHLESISMAIGREKQLKNWRREWKVALIEGENPQ